MKKFGKHTILGWSWRALLVGVLTPIVLFALLAILIYCPPVQKWAVDKAAEKLSEEMGMEVTVESVRLKFPLDLSMGGMLAIQEGDTVLNAEELRLSVQVRPLLDKQINVDDILLRNADVNTRELIDAVLIKGHIGELQAYTHGVNLNEQLVTVNKLDLKNSDIFLALPDTVPPDTTETEPSKLKLDFQDIKFNSVKFALALAQDKGYSVKDLCKQKDIPKYIDTSFGDAKCRAFVDIENSSYTVNDLSVENGLAKVDNAANLTDVSLQCDSICYSDPMNLYVGIKKLKGKEECGIDFKDVNGVVRMDSVNLYIDQLNVLTDDSQINADMTMDWTTWDDENPGIMQLDLKSVMGKSDVMAITRYVDRFLDKDSKLDAVRELAQEYLPNTPTPLNVRVTGNLNDLYFSDIQTNLKGIGRLEGSVRMRGDDISTKLRGNLIGGDALVSGSYNMNDESYDVDLTLNDFNVNKYADVGERTRLTGTVHAKGKGFDPYSPSTIINAHADIKKGCYGKVDLSSVVADIALKNSLLNVNASCNNKQLNTTFCLAGVLKKGVIDGSLDIELPFADLQAMGYSDDVLTVNTRGQMEFYSNLDDVFRIDSYMNGLDIQMGKDRIKTVDFDLYAETDRKQTIAQLTTGDLSFDFNAPYNLFTLKDKWDKMSKVADKQMKNHDVNLDRLKSYMPLATLRAKAGKHNPLITILKANGISFDDFEANLDSSPETGIVGNGHICALRYDTIRIDTAYFDIHQDSTRIVFNSGVKCDDQPLFPAFFATIDGYYGLTDADMRLQFFDKDNEKGIDFGVHFTDQDSVYNATFYPEEPILGFRKFAINDDNYVHFYKRKDAPITGYVHLEGKDDNSEIAFTGLNNEGHQRALVEVGNLGLGDLCKVLPFAPNMDGGLNIDAAYQEDDGRFWVDGMVNIDNFVYDGMKVGNVGSMFTYEPEGEGLSIHKVEGDISYEGIDVATLNGSYNTTGDGYLDADLSLHDIPMKMLNAFVPDQMVVLDGVLAGAMSVKGPTDRLQFDGFAITDSVTVTSPYYSVSLRLEDDTLRVADSKISFEKFKLYGAGQNPLSLDGYVDFSNMNKMLLSLQMSGRNVKLIEAKRTAKSVVFGDAYGDIRARVKGDSNDVSVRGYINVLPNTNLTYIMDDTTISQGDRLDDIVTFVNFELPPDTTAVKEPATILGVNMRMTLNVEEGAKFRVEFSADKQSYINVRGGGSLNLTYTPEGVMNAQGRLTVSEGEMKYALQIIPLKTFTIAPGSSVEFTGDLYNPVLDITATERTKAQVNTNGGATQSVVFDAGVKISNTLNNMGLSFTLAAPNSQAVSEELQNYTDEEKNKLAVALLATGMYMSDTNSAAITADNALSAFLQKEINSITGRALGSFVNVSLGVDEHTYDDGQTGNDYSFKFSKRFFSDRLNIVIGGSVSDNESVNKSKTIGSFIDDVSLEWRLDNSATRYVTLFHRIEYDNPVEGQLEKNGAGLVWRKKLSSISDIMFWKKKKTEDATPARAEEKRSEERKTEERRKEATE